MIDLDRAKKLGVNVDINDRWENGIDHHPKSYELFKALQAADVHDYFQWKSGGDGDNGEELMFQLDIYFDIQDALQKR